MKSLISGFAIAAFFAATAPALATQTEIDLSPYTNVDAGSMVNYNLPSAGSTYTIGGINFFAASYQGGSAFGAFSTATTSSLTISTDIVGASQVFTVVNSFWGEVTDAPVGRIDFRDAAGDVASFFYQEGVNLRDYYYGNFNNNVTSVYGTLYTNGGGYQSSDRLDAQKFDLGPSFAQSTLTSITFTGI